MRARFLQHDQDAEGTKEHWSSSRHSGSAGGDGRASIAGGRSDSSAGRIGWHDGGGGALRLAVNVLAAGRGGRDWCSRRALWL